MSERMKVTIRADGVVWDIWYGDQCVAYVRNRVLENLTHRADIPCELVVSPIP